MAIAVQTAATDGRRTPTPRRGRRRDPGGTTIPPVAFDHEQLAVRRGERSRALRDRRRPLDRARPGARRRADVALPGRRSTAIRDALRLAAGMTLKARGRELDLGGGKGVICAPPEGLEGERRRAALLDFGDLVESLDGRYITAEDVGTSPADLVAIARAHRARHRAAARARRLRRPEPVHGDRGRGGDPRLRAGSLRRATVSPGAAPAWSGSATSARGWPSGSPTPDCELAVSDIDPGKRGARRRARRRVAGARRGDADRVRLLAPCALGGAITRRQRRPSCAARSSAARPTTSSPTTRSPSVLAERGILYAPDFIANAGGLIHVYREIKGYSEERAMALAQGIERDAAVGARGRATSAGSPRWRRRASSPASGSTSLCETEPRWTTLLVVRLGLVPYEEARRMQRALERARLDAARSPTWC